MKYGLKLIADKCTGCLQCEMACSLFHDGVYNPSRSRIKIFDIGHGERSIPYTCIQCDPAFCMTACPTKAISIDEALGNAKLVDESLCVGCKVCTNACPYGTINYVPESGKVAKCDLCSGDPQCAQVCPTGAIEIIGEMA